MRVPDRALLAALLVVAAVLRFGALDREDLWLDEAQSVRVASGTFAEALELQSRDNKPPVYYLALHVWITLFGDGEAAIRSLSGVAGVLAVAVVWLLGTPMLSAPTARVAATLLALHPLAIHYSREGRNYALLLLLVLLAMVSLPRALESDGRRWWLVFAASLAAALMVHYITILLLPVFALQFATTGRHAKWKRLVAWTAVAFVPLSIWLPYARRQADVLVSSLNWFEPFWREWGLLEPFGLSLVMFLPGGAAPPWVGFSASATLQPFVILSGIAALACFLVHLRHDSRRGVIFGALMVPLVLLWTGSMISFPMYLVGRADYVALPGAIFLMATAVACARTRLAGGVVAALLAVSTLAGLVTYFRTQPANPESPALRALAAALRPGDVVVCTGLARPTAEYAIRRAGGTDVRIVTYPAGMSDSIAVYDPRPWSAEYLEAEADAIDDILREAKRGGGRAYLLLIGDEATGILRTRLGTRWTARTVGDYALKRVGTRVEIVEVVSRRQP